MAKLSARSSVYRAASPVSGHRPRLTARTPHSDNQGKNESPIQATRQDHKRQAHNTAGKERPDDGVEQPYGNKHQTASHLVSPAEKNDAPVQRLPAI